MNRIRSYFNRSTKDSRNITMPSTNGSGDEPPPPYNVAVMPTPVIRIENVSLEDHDLSLTTSSSKGNNGLTSNVLLKIQPTRGTHRTPVNICCVIDVSGSMGDEASFLNEQGSRESDGLSILDIVKHATKTVLSTMTKHDTLSIVTFSDTAEVELKPTEMNDEGKTKAARIIDDLRPTASTNLWAGLELGWDTIRSHKTTGKISSIFLFTDGMPNVIPPRGHLPMIKLYKDKHSKHGENSLCCVNTFGFGYQLDSGLLDEIARECDGNYIFIPDSSFVGTAFINATANLYNVMAENVTLRLEPNSEFVTDLQIDGGYQIVDSSWGKTIRVGNMLFDQPREFVVHLKHSQKLNNDDNGSYLNVFLDCQLLNSKKPIKKETCVRTLEEGDSANSAAVLSHIFRCKFIDEIEETMKTFKAGNEIVYYSSATQDELRQRIEAMKKSLTLENGTTDPLILAISEDLNGQVTEALLNPEYYNRWGRHYLLSLAGAHRSQICTNFKDPGIQNYGGPLFNALRDNFDEIFNSLPPPKPSRGRGTRHGPVVISSYNNRAGPCFHGSCSVQMESGETKMVRDILKGDRVKCLNDESAEVLCVLKTPQPGDKANLIELDGGLLITPYHPVFDYKLDKWAFPADINTGKQKVVACDAVYNFVLQNGHSMMINEVPCVTLGHGAIGDVREHSYFGSELILNDLKKKGGDGWEKGLVICEEVIRDPTTNLVCRMEFKS